MSEDRERVLCRGEPLRGEVFFFLTRVLYRCFPSRLILILVFLLLL
jgi:hypothetical protein